MTKNKIIGQIRIKAERDLTISDGALRLLFRICSARYVDPKAKMDDAFALPWSKVALWCGVNHKAEAYARVTSLVSAGYLKCDGLRGCPPINYYFLISNGRENHPIERVENHPINGRQNHPIKGVEKAPIKGVEKHPHHISNSFQEEKIKGKRGEFNSSLRSQERVGELKAASPEKRQLTDSEIKKGIATMKSQLASTLKPTHTAATLAGHAKASTEKQKMLGKK
jgi:hypothetical protein